jgi:topoisomerase-4 subunit B
LFKDGSVCIEDNGRGIPPGLNEKTGLSTVDTVFTVLHAGGKFDDSAYKTAGGLHGVGASVVNALSTYLTVVVKRDGRIYEAKYENGGKITQPLKVIGNTNKSGTTVTFLPDVTIFKNIELNANTIKERIRESSFLYKNLKISFYDENKDETTEFESNTGIIDFVKYLNEGKTTCNNIAFFEGKSDDIEVEISFQYTNSSTELLVSFANGVKTTEGGAHETAFKGTITELVNITARK